MYLINPLFWIFVLFPSLCYYVVSYEMLQMLTLYLLSFCSCTTVSIGWTPRSLLEQEMCICNFNRSQQFIHQAVWSIMSSNLTSKSDRCVYIYIHTHTYIYTHTHTYTHIYIFQYYFNFIYFIMTEFEYLFLCRRGMLIYFCSL